MADEWDVQVGFRYYRYTDDQGRSIELERDPGPGVPALIYVPTPARWATSMPPWAAEQRDLILARIRESTAHLSDDWRGT